MHNWISDDIHADTCNIQSFANRILLVHTALLRDVHDRRFPSVYCGRCYVELHGDDAETRAFDEADKRSTDGVAGDLVRAELDLC